MKSIFKEVCDTYTKRYLVEDNAELPLMTRYSVLVQVKACALSEVDDKVLQVLYRDSKIVKYPVGQDISGIVREVGNAVTTLKPGDEVVGIVPLDYGLSGCTEYVVLHEFDVSKYLDSLVLFGEYARRSKGRQTYSILYPYGQRPYSNPIVHTKFLDPPNSRTLYLKCASVGFLFEQAWSLSSTQQGRYLHILMDIMEKVADGIIVPNIHHTVPFDSVTDAMKCLSEIRVGKVVMKME
ncbi:quinone oxidoreductase-like protein 1 [Centruroides sculpturatus]|uniref:quinone oxidoreductase-like protein 1 n=1 Tax=Centruroides sculpturatus TaxID=218467 RepID=UPI000C6C9C1D|nr:quinone oxidoreductase-like protein 1 [Centruroides sculpturatus]